MWNTDKNKVMRLFLCNVLILFISTSLLLTNFFQEGNNCFVARRARKVSDDLGSYLEVLNLETIAGIESQAKFVIHSGPSGVGQGTVKESMLENYPGRFQRFLLYATRDRRGIEFEPSESGYGLVKKYLEMAEEGSVPESMDDLESELSKDERFNIDEIDSEQYEELKKRLFPTEEYWDEILVGSPRVKNPDILRIPTLNERIAILDNGKIKVFREFDGVHYWFVTQEELFQLGEEGVIIEPVRDYYQGIDLTKVSSSFEEGNDNIVVLEGARVWFDHVNDNFPETTSIFIAPISGSQIKERMLDHIINTEYELRYLRFAQDILNEINISSLLRGGIEYYIAEQVPELINIPSGLKPSQNKAFLNVKNAIMAAVAYKITHPEVDIKQWMREDTSIISNIEEKDYLEIVNEELGTDLDFDKLVYIASSSFKQIAKNRVKLVAMRVIIEEMARRIEFRVESQDRNPKDPTILSSTYMRASQSPREYGGSLDYGKAIVNYWGLDELDKTIYRFTKYILQRIMMSIPN